MRLTHLLRVKVCNREDRMVSQPSRTHSPHKRIVKQPNGKNAAPGSGYTTTKCIMDTILTQQNVRDINQDVHEIGIADVPEKAKQKF